MNRHRSITRHNLDTRLLGLEERIGERPTRGWVRTLREALGMTGPELAARLNVSPSRVSRIERAELDGSLQLSTLGRAGEALNCRLLYVLAPSESLETMVRQQARRKAVAQLGASSAFDPPPEDRDRLALRAALRREELDALAYLLADRRGLWTTKVRAGSDGASMWDKGATWSP